MTTAVLLDTSFLISLVDGKRPNHSIAVQYYRLMLEQQSPMFFSAIVAAEFAIKQPIRDLENTKIPLIIFAYCKNGGAAYEDNDLGTKWCVGGNGGLDFAFG
ncbi:MAG: PIN domain-containing protein [Gallionella sp.]|nr:PIN domain-containing protein [Gallionella sp.]